MLSFEQFKVSPLCKPVVWSEEDTPQDRSEGLRLVREDQERQWEAYQGQQPEIAETSEEKRVAERLTMLRNNRAPVAQQPDEAGKRSRAEYFREYRQRPKKCKHCGEQL